MKSDQELKQTFKLFVDEHNIINMVTPSLILKSLATTISSTSGKSEGIRMFDNKEKALKWLK